MALNCPTCKTPLERNGETAHCATCDKDFTVQALCPECHHVSFVANGIQFPTSQQASEYNKLIAPLPAQHQAFNQAWTTAVTATQ